ncbi:MAG: hypothetical protein N2319_05000 [Candidatus Kapabacteria bacterium]|nr:hypothetical protein [Candidatus Kapabacteria bacterium]
MPETSGIHEIINPGGTGSSFSPAYSKLPTKPSIRKSRLKIGEIVPGKILEVHKPDIAIVSLPEGNFSAVLHSNLRSDDYLYFKVIETEPNLLLKIHSVPVKFEGKEISNSDIIRILDIPSNNFFIELISSLKKIRKNILRDEIIVINQFFANLPNEFKDYTKLNIAFNLILFLLDNKIQLSHTNYFAFSNVFYLNKLANSLEIIYKYVKKTNDDVFKELNDIFEKIKNPEKSIKDLFDVFLYENSQRSQLKFYDAIARILDRIGSDAEFSSLIEPLKVVMRFIEILHIFNLINYKNKNNLLLILPYFRNDKFYLARINVQRNNKYKIETAELRIETKKFDKIDFKIQKMDEFFEILIKNNTLKFQQIIKEFINTLASSLESKELKLGLVKIVSSFEIESSDEEKKDQTTQAISVVI